MISSTRFEFLTLPDCGTQTAEIARRLSPHYHCIFFPCVEESQIEPLTAEGFYCRSAYTTQDLSLAGFGKVEDCLASLPAKRRNDIMQSVKRAEGQGIEVSVNLFRHTPDDFRDIYTWYFDVYRPYAATHFPNKYRYSSVEDLNRDLLGTYRRRPFLFAKAVWNEEIIGASLLRHIPAARYRQNSSFNQAFADERPGGDVLQMFMHNSGPKPIGNINTYLYYCIIAWCIKQGYRAYSFGRENVIVPPEDYLNVLGSKRSWGTTTVLEHGPASLHFVMCNRKALLHLRSDYFLFHWTRDDYRMVYFANTENVPKALSQTLEGDSYIHKHVYTRNRSVFSYLEKRAARWSKTLISLCNSEGLEESSIVCL